MRHQPSPGRPAESRDTTREQWVRPATSYVLVVDDEASIRSYLTRSLEGWGYASRMAASATEALEMMAADPAALVLCDIKMPGEDGLWLLQRLREHWPDTPVIMTTGLDDVDTVRHSRELGAADYLAKPIKADRLRQAVQRAVASDRLTPSASSEPLLSPAARFDDKTTEAEYTLESPVRCPACGERIATLNAVRLIRAHVNFTSTLPRRGRVMVCPHCVAIVPAELTNF